ncbi:unnamed protein product, partial [Lepidochelys olivacea]
FQVQYPVSQTLVLLGRCNILRKSIISLLLSEVNQFADELQQAHQIEGTGEEWEEYQQEQLRDVCIEETTLKTQDEGTSETVENLWENGD